MINTASVHEGAVKELREQNEMKELIAFRPRGKGQRSRKPEPEAAVFLIFFSPHDLAYIIYASRRGVQNPPHFQHYRDRRACL